MIIEVIPQADVELKVTVFPPKEVEVFRIGDPGISVVNAYITGGHLILVLSDASEIDAGLIPTSLTSGIGDGIRITGTDGGNKGDLSLDDDYLYICVLTGNSTSAIWKKTLLFQSL